MFRRNPDFRRLFAGQVISYCGDWFLTVALLDLVLELTDSGLLAGLLVVGQTLPAFLLSPYAGTVVDRVDRRKVMIAVNLVNACLALLALLARTPETLVFAYITVIGISCGVAFFSPSAQAALPNVVRPEDLGRANVIMGGVWGTMLAVGAAVGGFVTWGLGREASMLIDSLCLITAALIFWSIRTPFQQTRAVQEHTPFLPALAEAARYARRNVRVLALLSAKGGFGLSSGVVVLLSVFSHEVFDAGAVGIGVLYGARGAGALLGPFVMRRVGGSDTRAISLIGLGTVVYGIGYIAFAISPVLALAALAVFGAHLGGGGVWTMSSFGLQRTVPDELRGRIFAADFGLVMLTSSLSSLIAGALADTLGAPPTAFLLAMLALVWGVTWTVWTRRLWIPAQTAAPPPVEVGSRRA